MNFLPLIASLGVLTSSAGAADSLIPYASADVVPQNVVALWAGVDARKDALETEVIQEWREDGVVCRYVIFKVGTFKGTDSRLAAFYTFPEGAEGAPAFVWAHGGGQRAERQRGSYFARHGYATVDINWGGREMVEGTEPNTDWGALDPSQGPKFYPGALRQHFKANLLPDAHTIDPVISPRNSNWFVLTYAARRAITFLEQQAEVDAERIGFTGYSMGGNITSYVAIDPRLKAVAPMVGGAGFISSGFPGLPDPRRAHQFGDHVKLFADTMESQSYYPHVAAPVLMLSASDDFHAAFDNVYRCMAALPHDDWRASQKMHFNHGLGASQWVLLNRWFDKYLKGESIEIPKTAETTLVPDPGAGRAAFTVKPDQLGQLVSLDIYFSHDPNPQSRFWKRAGDVADENGTFGVRLPLEPGLPLFVFANCTYPLGSELEAFEGGKTSHFTLTSNEEMHLPATWDLNRLTNLATSDAFSPDFETGWGEGRGGGLVTYKFRDPEMRIPGAGRALHLKLDGVDARYGVRLRVKKNKFLTGVRDPEIDYVANSLVHPGDSGVTFALADFLDSEMRPMEDWNQIATLSLDVIERGRPLPLQGDPMIGSLDWVDVR